MVSNVVNEFRSYLASFSDVARADRFRVLITAPKGLLDRYGNVSKRFVFQCESTELPGKSLETFEQRTYGTVNKYPYHTTFSDLTLTFWCTANENSNVDSGMWEKAFFEDWFEIINPTPDSMAQQQYNFEYKDVYATTLTMEHFDVTDKRTYAVKFIDAFPIAMSPIAVSWQDESIIRLQVAFAYTRWERTTQKFTQSFLTENISTSPAPELEGKKPELAPPPQPGDWFNAIEAPLDPNDRFNG